MQPGRPAAGVESIGTMAASDCQQEAMRAVLVLQSRKEKRAWCWKKENSGVFVRNGA